MVQIVIAAVIGVAVGAVAGYKYLAPFSWPYPQSPPRVDGIGDRLEQKCLFLTVTRPIRESCASVTLARHALWRQFTLDLVVGCLDYTDEVETLVSAPGGTVNTQMDSRQGSSQQGSMTVSGVTGIYEQQGCDEAAQAIQNLTSRDFGHRVTDSISERDKAIKAIRTWWAATHPVNGLANRD